MKKRLLSALLALCLVVGMVPTTLLTAHAAVKTPVKVTEVSISGLDSLTPEVDNLPIDLDSITAAVQAHTEGTGTSATTGSTHSNVQVTGAASITSGAEKRTDGKYYWKAGSVATITIKVTAYTDDAQYSPSLALTGTSLIPASQGGQWILTQSGSTVTAKYDKNNDGKITTSGADNDTIEYLTNATTLTGTYVDATTVGSQEISNLNITVVEGQKAYLYLSSLNEQDLKGGSISVDSGSVPTYFIRASGSGNPATITIEGLKATTGSVTFNLKTAKAGNCAEQYHAVTVTVLPKLGGFQLATPVSTLKIGDTANLTAAVTAADGSITHLTGGSDIDASNMRFEVDDDSILTVDESGVVTGKAPGKATITAIYLDGNDNAMSTSKVTIQVVRASIPVPVPQPDTYIYMSGETTFQWVTKPQGDVYILLNGVQVTGNLPENLKFAPAGDNKVTVSLKNPELDQWADGTTADKVFTWKVAPKQLNSDSVTSSITNPEYNGKPFTVNAVEDAQKLELTLSDAATGSNLKLGVDYTVISHQNNLYVGNQTGMVTVQGKGNYAGTKSWSFSITAPSAPPTVDLPAEVTRTAGSSVDLKSLVTTTGIVNFEPSKLTGTGFLFTLADADKTKATLKDSTLKLNNNLGHGAEVSVTMTYTGSYDANGDGEPEYSNVTVGNGTLLVKIASKTQVVSIPNGIAGLSYIGKEQVGVVDGALYNLTGTGSPAAAPADYPDSDAENNGKEQDAGKYTTIVYLDQSKAAANTTLTWPDGTVEPKRVTWEISKATPKVTVSFTPFIQAGQKLNEVELTTLTAVGVNGESLSGDARWDADPGTYIVQGAAYGWTWTSGDDNYKDAVGSAVILGNTTGTSGSEQTPEQENPNQDITTSTVTNPDGSTTTITNNKKTGVVTHVTTASNGTSSELTYTKGALTAASATSTAANAVAYVPMTGVSWGSVITINGAARMDAGLPAEGLDGMWVVLPAGTVSLGLRNQAASFTDVRTNEWFYKAVMLASSRNLIQGIGSNSYGPAGTLNFGQVWSMLARYTGDVTLAQSTGNNWYVQPQNWAYRNNISSGVSYDANATREDVALMMYRTYALENGTPTNVNTSYLSSMSDYGSVSSAARTAVAWAIQNGIIQGYPNGTFQPHNSIRRDEAAQMMARFVYVMEGVNVPSDFMS